MRLPTTRALAAVGTSAVLTAAGSVLAPVSATGTQVWAPAATATIHPGTMMYTKGAQCTANFVYADAAGNTYLGYAAHCAGTGGSSATDGCTTGSLPLGTRVAFSDDGNPATRGTVVGHGRLVYSSWLTMQRRHEQRKNVCAFNDLALVRVRPADVAKVNPSVPSLGGPLGLDRDGTAAGDPVYTYGDSSLRAGISALSVHTGVSLGDQAADGGWSHPVYTVAPGIPGDSGSGFLNAQGRALGVLSTVELAPLAGENGVGDLAHELRYARLHSGIAGLHLVRGTEAFNPPL